MDTPLVQFQVAFTAALIAIFPPLLLATWGVLQVRAWRRRRARRRSTEPSREEGS